MPPTNLPDPQRAARVALALQLDALVTLCLAADATAVILEGDTRRASVRQALDAVTFDARTARRRLRQRFGDDGTAGEPT